MCWIKMRNLVLFGCLLIAFVVLDVTGCTVTANDDTKLLDTLLADPSSVTAENDKELSIDDIYVECNKSFIISMDYLNELNDTGSFPDETDKTPMCFIRCFLLKNGILTDDDKVNKERALSIDWVKNGESIDDCLQEMTGNPCERAYFLTRCVTIRRLVDDRSRDNKRK
ncbi:general odorant-binding protein 84a [Toxorhynchites rutilus septentrionalis]|uniref:general odorant-binding protein 84a n=1 Tax=Toxorhynchites rutilus septentrionalis TaxID=329112 RepID=UPI00247A11CB|nr:general odorant-binding protein 84a [Toxorhynchites rutilus septentrionalis]